MGFCNIYVCPLIVLLHLSEFIVCQQRLVHNVLSIVVSVDIQQRVVRMKQEVADKINSAHLAFQYLEINDLPSIHG